jgi:tripartite-type tricarboxylate transporter receptor subunit TctC
MALRGISLMRQSVRFNNSSTKRSAAAMFALLALLNRDFAAQAQPAGAKPFYDGKTIQLIASSGTGATTDITARFVARFLGKHIPGNPGIIVHNMPGGGGLVAANYVYNISKPDGLTILAVSRANYLDQMVGRAEVRTDFRKLNWLGSFNKSPMMLACRSDTPYKSVAALRQAKVAARVGQSGTGSISYIFAKLIEKILDLKLRNVSGFQSARETDLGMERGEVDCRATSDITVLRSPWNRWVKEKYLTFILQQGPDKSDLLPPVPTVYELAPADAKPTVDLMTLMLAYTDFDRPFAAPPTIPKDRLQLIRDGFQKMLKDAEFAVEAKKLLDWDGDSYLTGEQLQKRIAEIVTQPPDVIKRIKLILEE